METSDQKQLVRRYEILMAAVISARATSFMFNKMLLEDMSPFNLLAMRFLIAFCLLPPGTAQSLTPDGPVWSRGGYDVFHHHVP